MKEFSKHESVDGMVACMKLPVVVHSMRIDEPFVVNTDEGKMTGNPGDRLMRGVNGELYPCAANVYEKTYTEDVVFDEVSE